MCECDCECRPLGFLLGLPFALLAFLVSIVGVLVWIVGPLGFLLGLPFALLAFLVSLVGVLVWIVGILLSCICPCCICVTLLVEFALELIKAPLHVMEWFTSQIPC